MQKYHAGSRKKSHRRFSTLALANALMVTSAASSDASNPDTGSQSASTSPSATPTTATGATVGANKPTANSTGDSSEDKPLGADRIVVDASAIDSYQAENSANAKYTESLRDTPQTVTVIPQQLIKDENATTLQQALRNVPGITFTAGEGGTLPGDNINIRGFNARQDLFVDGFRDTGVYNRDPFILEQIEVVEGPASAYSGHGSTGGYVNLITKAPTLKPTYDATVGFGTDSYYRDTVDVNLPLTKLVPGAAFRLNGLYQYNEFADRDEVYTSRYGVYPELAFGIGTNTTLTLSYLYLHESDLPSFGLPTVNATAAAANPGFANQLNHVAPVDYSNFYGFTKRDHEDSDTHIPTVTLAHSFDNGWTLVNTARYEQTFVDEITTPPRFDTGLNYFPSGALAGNYTATTFPADTLTRELRGRRQLDSLLGDQAELTTHFDTWKFHHNLVVTAEISQERENYRTSNGNNVITSLSDPSFNDSYPFPIVYGNETRARLNDYACSLFDSIKLIPQLILSGGVRYDHLDARSDNAATATAKAYTVTQTNDLASWRTALTYKPIEPVSIYFGYGTSYNPSVEGAASDTSSPAGLNSTTSSLEPEKNETYEFGVKADVLKDKLSLTASFFRTNKENARITDPTLPTNSGVYILAGEVRVQGIELGFRGNVTDKWAVFGGYSYLETDFLSGPNIGRQLPYTPNQSATIFTTYKLPYHFTVGVGSQFIDKQFGSVANTTSVPGYHIEQALIGYQATKNIGVQFNIYNLAGKEYIAQYGNGGAIPGSGRSMTCTVNLDF